MNQQNLSPAAARAAANGKRTGIQLERHFAFISRIKPGEVVVAYVGLEGFYTYCQSTLERKALSVAIEHIDNHNGVFRRLAYGRNHQGGLTDSQTRYYHRTYSWNEIDEREAVAA